MMVLYISLNDYFSAKVVATIPGYNIITRALFLYTTEQNIIFLTTLLTSLVIDNLYGTASYIESISNIKCQFFLFFLGGNIDKIAT